jgi:phosphopantothenoylcysteine decarboxylase/phosphopantothenate--cysteine ligase
MSDPVSAAPRVLLCVSGGIAAYKTPALVRGLVAAGMEVQVLMTEAAAAFVTELSLSTVSRRPVRTTLLDAAAEGSVGHIELADWPDVVLVAPATAHVLARAAHGLADDLVTTCLLATRAPILWAPAMNTNMWRHVATQKNLATLAARGDRFAGPDRGDLACGWVGEGRMIDPPVLVAAVEAIVAAQRGASDWSGRRVLVSAGPTRAYLDPVRFLTNASTGVMGFALAEAAARRGADVTLVAGPVSLPTPAGVHRIDVQTAEEMLAAMDQPLRADPFDLVAMVAAVADLAPAQPASQKIETSRLRDALSAGAWVEGVDVLATLTHRHAARSWFLGFGAQTVDAAKDVEAQLRQLGERKLARKGCQALFVNRVGVPGVGFGSETNAGLLLLAGPEGPQCVSATTPVTKARLAGWILDEVARARFTGASA